MTFKNSIISIFLILLIAAMGYFFFAQRSSQNANTSNLEQSTNQNGDQAKINIDQVCEESLMFTTFTDGAAADLYVKECKEGKHPQVIEDYKIRMGLTSGELI